MKMRLVERDIEILNCFRLWRFATIEQIARLCFEADECISESERVQASSRLRKLWKQGLIKRETDYRTGRYIYSLDNLGKSLLVESGQIRFSKYFPPNHPNYFHEFQITEAVSYISSFGVGKERMAPEKFSDKSLVGERFISDINIKLSESRYLFLEVELSRKSKRRIKNKLNLINQLNMDNSSMDLSWVYLCNAVANAEQIASLRDQLAISKHVVGVLPYSDLCMAVRTIFNNKRVLVNKEV